MKNTSMHSTESQVKALLVQELDKRVSSDQTYSLRKFAKSLGVSHTALSLILSGKRRISKKSLRLFSERLHLKLKRTKLIDDPLEDVLFQQVSLDHQAYSLDWYYDAILCLVDTQRTSLTAKTIARELGISEAQVRTALARLERLGMISLSSGKMVRHHLIKKLETEIAQPKGSRKLQRKWLDRSAYALDHDWTNPQQFFTASIAIHPKDIPELMKSIATLERRFKKNSQKKKGSEVYAFTAHVFSLTSPARRKSTKSEV